MRNPFKKRNNGGLMFSWAASEDLCIPGYVTMDKVPEVVTACRRIAELIGSMTLYLMNSTEKGDFRIKNELSRTLDILPAKHMTRTTWAQANVMNMLLYGRGNAVCLPHTHEGLLGSIEPIAASRVTFQAIGYSDYNVLIDGKPYKPENLLHFVYNPDRTYLWKGQGVTVSIKDIAENLMQAAATKKGFMASKWKPSLIIKVDAMSDIFSSPAGRQKILDEYVRMDGAGQPFVIPDEQISIEQVRPLSLSDLAINDAVEIDKKTVAAIFGLPPFLLGVGDYDQKAWNSFVQNTVRPIATSITQEMTRKLILSPNWYLRYNVLSLMDWNLETIANVYGGLSDRGFVTGNEVRDRIGLSPIDGLDEVRILENYLPWDLSGKQKKLVQEGEE